VPRSFAQKLVVSLTIIVVIIAVVSGLINVRNQEKQLLAAMVVGADQLSRGIASSTWHAMLADNREAAYSVMKTIAEKQGIDRIRIYNRDGVMMFSTIGGESGQRVDRRAEVCAICHSGAAPKEQLTTSSRALAYRAPDGHRALTMVTPIYNEPSCSQAECHAHPRSMKVLGVLDVTLSAAPVDHEVADMKWWVALVTSVQIVLIALFIVFFTRRFVASPIQQLIAGAKAVSAMELEKHIVVRHGSQEIDELVSAFNGMKDRLREAIGEINEFTEKLEAKVQERTDQLKVAQQKLLQSDRLASLGQLAASVAHEINNPVAGVLNLSTLMQRIMGENGVPDARVTDFRKYLSQVITETTRVGRIVSDLLSFSRRSKPQHAPSDLNKIVRTTLSLVSHKLKLLNIEVESDLAEDLPQLSCDASQIQQVVVNLVLNGAEAMQSKKAGRLTLRTRVFEQRESAILEVSDTGEGIPPENVSKIFDPFFTTKPEGKGVGLGLAVVYGIVQSHGGEVDVQSQPAQGTTFTVTLPVHPIETTASPVVIPIRAGAPGVAHRS
jgi:two-component system NtrC family sensor kinase